MYFLFKHEMCLFFSLRDYLFEEIHFVFFEETHLYFLYKCILYICTYALYIFVLMHYSFYRNTCLFLKKISKKKKLLKTQ